MIMTPAEMREMAASACDRVSDGDVECLNQVPDEIRRHYHTGGRDAAAMCARIVRAIPIPDTTAADDALEKARDALFRCHYDMQVHRVFVTSREQAFSAEVYDAAINGALAAIDAIDAAKAKGGG